MTKASACPFTAVSSTISSAGSLSLGLHKNLILTGLTGDICILFTASDAHLRDYHLFIPSDCVVSQDPFENQRALKFMERVLDADVRPSTEFDLGGS